MPALLAAVWLPWVEGGAAAGPPVPALLGTVLLILAAGAPEGRRWKSSLPQRALLGLCIVAVLQMFLLPAELANALSPEGARLRGLLQWEGAAALSLSPAATLNALFLLLAMALAFVAGRRAGAGPGARTGALRGLLALAAAVAVVSLGRGVDPADEGRLAFPFEGPNRLAAFLGAGILCAGGLFVLEDRRRGRLMAVVLALPCAVALAMTGSRLGTVLPLAGLGVLHLLRRRGADGRRGGPLFVAVLLGGALLLAGGVLGQRWGRFLEVPGFPGTRWAIAGAGLDAALPFTWTGAGLGTFREVFPALQPVDLPGTWTHPHNEAVALFFEGGVAGVALALGGFAALVLGLRRRARHGDSAGTVAATALVALLVLALHGSVDLVLRVPALLMAAAGLAGLGWGCEGSVSAATGEEELEAPEPPPEGPRRTVSRGFLASLAFGGLVGFVMARPPDHARPFLPDVHLAVATAALDRGDRDAAEGALDRASAVAGSREPARRRIRDLRKVILDGEPSPARLRAWLEEGRRVVERAPGWLRRYLEEGEAVPGAVPSLSRLVPGGSLAGAVWAEYLLHRNRAEEAREVLRGLDGSGIPGTHVAWYHSLRSLAGLESGKGGASGGR